MFEYELDGEVLQFTQEDVDNRAKEKGLTTEDYLAQHPEVKPVSVKKTKDVAETGAPVASITPALPQVPLVEAQNTASRSEDTSLEQPKIDSKDIVRQAQFEVAPFSQKIGMVTENIFDMVTDLVTDKEERQETAVALQNQLTNMPQRLKDTFTKDIPALTLKTAQAASLDPVFKQSPEVDKFIIDKFKEIEVYWSCEKIK